MILFAMDVYLVGIQLDQTEIEMAVQDTRVKHQTADGKKEKTHQSMYSWRDNSSFYVSFFNTGIRKLEKMKYQSRQQNFAQRKNWKKMH